MAARLRVPLFGLVPGEFVLAPDAARYVTRVHRLRAGAEFVLFDPEARVEADARILDAGRVVRCLVGELRAAAAVARTGVTLIQALGKGDKAEGIVRDGTALGVERIVFCISSRTVADPGGRGTARLERLRAVAVDAARQSRRGDVPTLEGFFSFDESLARESSRAGRRLCLVPGASVSLGAAVRGLPLDEPITVLIGPEGGFDAAEVARAAASGFVAVSFGPFVLRTETAATAVLGALVARA